jgi:hypothetical protein
VGATVCVRSQPAKDLVWDGPWVKPVDKEILFGHFSGWDEKVINIIKVAVDFPGIF